MIAEGQRQLAMAQAELVSAQLLSLITVLNLADYSNRNPGNAVGEVVTKQKAYEESKAKLEYFTKVPDLQTLKDRLQKYGELQSDPDPDLTAILYSLTEEDLRYLVELDEDNNIISLDSSGNLQSFTDEEESEVYNAKTLQSEAEYTDSFGRKYDRDQIITYMDPNYFGFYREGNVYRNANLSGEYTRIRVAGHDGTIRFGYALLNEDVENKSVYHAGSILRSFVDHGNELREKRVDAYLLAGSELTDNGNDWSFILAERDNTMKDLFDESVNKNDGEGGREFAGYTMVYADYEANQKAVFDLELQQRVNVQRKEWNLREQELLARKQEWEARIEAMLKAGNRAWTDAEDRFLSEWREWGQEFDRKIEEGNQEWNARIASHMTDRQQWETDLKQKASEAASEAALTDVLGGFNVQLQTLATNAGIRMSPINLNDAVEKAKSEILANLPTHVEQLASINGSIERFHTNLSLSEMWGTDTQSVLAGLATDFHNEMNQFQKQMVVYSNSKVMAQYQQLLNDLLEQIDRQNRAIEQQTELAAMQAGFIRSGNVYIKQSKLVSSAIGMVEAYQWFDGKAAFDDYLSSIGDGYGGALVSDHNGGATHKSRDEIMADLPAFLETADTVQVESFFAVQKMILQNAFQKIMGTGSASERQNSRDKNVIGDLAWWIGTPAGSNNRVSSTLDQENPLKGLVDGKVQEEVANLTYKKKPTQALGVLKYLGDSGFGELGSMGNRPSGIYLGFYNKLDIVSRYVDGKDADKMSQIAGSIDPITATLNQFNPAVMLATSIQNVRVASEVYGTGSGYMVEAQLLGAVKTPLRVAGSMLVAAGTAVVVATGWTGVGALAGGGAIALGAAMSALSNSIHVDTTTGKRSYQMTDQGALATLTDVIGGTAGGYASYAAKASNAAAVAQATNATSETIKAAEIALATAKTAQNFALGGTAALSLLQSGAEFDSSGRYTGNWSLEGARGDSFLQSIATGAISAGISTAITKGFDIKSGYAQDIISSVSSVGVNTLSEYYKYQQGYQNNYAAITSPDIGNASAFWSLMTTMGSRSNNSSTDATSGEWSLDNALSGFKEGFLNQFTGLVSLGSLFANTTEQVYSMVANLFGFARKREEELANVVENGEEGAPTMRPPTDTERKAVVALLYSSNGPLETEKEIAKLERENVDISDIRKLVDTTRQASGWRSLNDAEKQALNEFREEIGLNSILFKLGINIKLPTLSKVDIRNFLDSFFSKKIDKTNPFLTEKVIAALLADVQLEYNQWPTILGEKHVRKAMQMVENDPSLMSDESVRQKFKDQRMKPIPVFDKDNKPVLNEYGYQVQLPAVSQGLCVVMGVYLMLKYEGANVGNFEDYYIQGINKEAIKHDPGFDGYVIGYIDTIVSPYRINGKEFTAEFVNGNDLTEFKKSDARIITIRNAAKTHTYVGYRTENGDIYQADVGHAGMNGKPISVNDISSYRYLKLK